MKTQFLTHAVSLLKGAVNNTDGAQAFYASCLNKYIDYTRDTNGNCPELILEDYYILNDIDVLKVGIHFNHDASTEFETLELPIVDFQKWCVWNGYAIWHNQNVGQLAWNMTVEEEISGIEVKMYLQDICTARVAYKQAEFVLRDYKEDELYNEFNEEN